MNTTPSKKSGKGMSQGVVSELSTFFHVRPGHEAEISAAVKRFHAWLREVGPDIHLKIGLREWRQVLFDNDQRLMLVTSFETDWDPYIDDALQVFGPERFMDWLKHTVEAEAHREKLLAMSEAVRKGETRTAAAFIKTLLQSAQSQATAYVDVLSDQTVPQIRKAQQVEKAFQQVLDNPAAMQALQQPALKPLLDQAAS